MGIYVKNNFVVLHKLLKTFKFLKTKPISAGSKTAAAISRHVRSFLTPYLGIIPHSNITQYSEGWDC